MTLSCCCMSELHNQKLLALESGKTKLVSVHCWYLHTGEEFVRRTCSEFLLLASGVEFVGLSKQFSEAHGICCVGHVKPIIRSI